MIMNPSRVRRARAAAQRLHERVLQPQFAIASVGLLVFGSVLLIGGVHPVVALGFAIVGVVMCVAWLAGGEAPPRPTWVLVALGFYSALQAVPLPLPWLQVLAPTNADIWSRALLPMGDGPPPFASLSLAPALSLLAAANWITYGVAFWAARRARNPEACVRIVLAAATFAALVTLAHGVLGAERVFGVYEPSVSLDRWRVGPLINGNNLSGYLNFGAICGLGLLTIRSWRPSHWPVVFGVIVCASVSFSTGSRGGLASLALGLAAGALLLLRSSSGGVRRISAASLTLLGGTVLAAVTMGSNASREFVSTEIEKVELARWARPMIIDFWRFGVGRGAFGGVFHAYAEPRGDMVFEYAENFPVQWLSEWGIPVTLAFCLCICAFVRGMFARKRGAALRAAVLAGTIALLAQNLVDLAFEVPAVCVALVVALGAVSEPSRRGEPSTASAKVNRRGAWVVAGACGAVVVTAICATPRRLAKERDVAYRAYSSGDSSALGRQLRRSMGRFPAEPYFSRLGALDALRTGRDPMPWLQRALERGPNNGRTHLILSDVVARRGGRGQALLELRWAMELHDDLVRPGTLRALGMTQDPAQLERAVPLRRNRSPVLLEMAKGLTGTSRENFARRAQRESPDLPGPRRVLAISLLGELTQGHAGTCAPRRQACVEEVQQCADFFVASSVDQWFGYLLRARLAVLDGRLDQAQKELNYCDALAEPADCFPLQVEVALARGDVVGAELAATKALGRGCRSRGECARLAAKLALVFEKAELWEHAWQFRRRAAHDEGSIEALLGAAQAAGRAGRRNDELQILMKATRLFPDDLAAHRALEAAKAAAAASPFTP